MDGKKAAAIKHIFTGVLLGFFKENNQHLVFLESSETYFG